MKVRKTLLAAAGWAGYACAANAADPTMAVPAPPPSTTAGTSVFSSRPTNLWDLLTGHRQPAVVSSRPTTIVVPPPKPDAKSVQPKVEPKIAMMPASPEPESKRQNLEPVGPSPYYATAITPPATHAPSEPLPSAVSSYHPTSASPLSPTTVVKTTAAMSPYNAAVAAAPLVPPPVMRTSAPTAFAKLAPAPTAVSSPAPMPAPVPMPAPTPAPVASAMPAPQPTPLPPAIEVTPAPPLTTKPMPAPPAPVIPAGLNPGMVDHLLRNARGDNPIDVRKQSIRELAKLKAKTPEVMVALDGLSDDPEPSVRAEAIIAAARLRMSQ
jgi:hypothetical protein